MNKNLKNYIEKDADLKAVLKAILLYNMSEYAPYHNTNHLLTVAKYAYEIATDSQFKDTFINLKELIIAALLHDADHLMGEAPVNAEIKKETDATWAVTGQKNYKRKFIIPIGGKSKAASEKAISKVMNNYKEDIDFDAESGELKMNNIPFNFREDVWSPSPKNDVDIKIDLQNDNRNIESSICF